MDSSYERDPLRCNISLVVTDGEDAANHEYTPTEKTLVTIIMPAIMVFGLIGNFGFIFVLWRVTWMRTTLNFFLTHLAIADIIFLSVSIIEKIIAYAVSPIALDKYFMGDAGCILFHLVPDTCYFASVSLVTVVTFERYYATCRPHVHREHSTRARPIRLVSIVWFFSFAVACSVVPSTSLFFTVCLTWPDEEKYQFHPDIMGLCFSLDGKWVIYANIIHAAPFVIAMLINIVFFSLIIRALNSMVARAQRSGFSDRSQHIRDRVSRMLVINGVVFFFCLTPFQVTTYIAYNAAKPGVVWLQICRMLLYVNSAVNPVVYNITNVRYRKAFRYAFTTGRGHSHLNNYNANRPSSNIEMNARGNTNNTRATFNSNVQTSSQQVKTTASTF